MTVDIMLPYYGDPTLLKLAVRSVQAQDDPEWRFVIVDDGYPDASVAEWFAALGDIRVEYRRNEVNLGANGNYRRCLELVENDLAVLMGADDLMRPDYIRTVKGLHRSFPEAGLIQVGVECIDETGAAFRGLVDRAKQLLYAPSGRGPRLMGGEALATSLLRGNWLYFPSVSGTGWTWSRTSRSSSICCSTVSRWSSTTACAFSTGATARAIRRFAR